MGDIIKLMQRRAAPDGRDVHERAACLKLREDVRYSPAAGSPHHADKGFMASSKEALETLLRNVTMQHDRLDRVINAVPDEKARTRYRYALDLLRYQIEFVRTIARSI